jgi:hypothetical protein
MTTDDALSAQGALHVHGAVERWGAVTAIVPGQARPLLLTCGHVALPAMAGEARLSTSYPNAHGEASNLVWSDRRKTRAVALTLESGELSAARDVAVAEISGAGALDFTHPALGTAGPFPVRVAECIPGTKVFQWSWVRGTLIGGLVPSPAYASVSLLLDDGTSQPYERLLAVRAKGADFSEPGDSGSLVVDDDYRAVGLLVGVSNDRLTAYVLPVGRLHGALAGYSSFFTVS